MNSTLLECRLLHHRMRPKHHRFTNRIFFFALDLAELDGLARRLILFSRNRRNLYSFREDDFLPQVGPPKTSLLARVRQELARHGIAAGETLQVTLVTIPRIAGYLFNPVSFYFCYEGNRPLCALAEVTNTFREVKTFVVPASSRKHRFEARLPKEFYVSPFSECDGEFAFALRWNGDRLVARIDEYEAGVLTLHSVVLGEKRVLNNLQLFWFTLKYPLLGLQVMGRIHTQALRLYLKRLPWWRKAAQSDLQRNFHRPGDIRPANAGETK
jgi:uncharacterized protein